MSRQGRVTLHDLARHAGVSTATVSLVLRKSPLVAARTRERVQESIRAIGYVYNRGAASMRSLRTHTVGAAMNDLSNPYFIGLIAALEQSLSDERHMIFLANCHEDPSRQARFLEAMQEYNADGVVVCPAEHTDGATFATLVHSLRLPCVLVSRDLPGSGLDYVGHDHRGGMRQGVEHLIKLGHRRIAMVGGNLWNWTGQERRQGWREALLAHGIEPDPSLDLPSAPTRSAGAAAIDRLLDLAEPPTAAACFNDILAFGVMLGLRHRNMEPGRDFSVLGSDDVLEAALWTPALTSNGINPQAMGEGVARVLLARIETPDAPPQRIVLPPHLVIRESTGQMIAST